MDLCQVLDLVEDVESSSGIDDDCPEVDDGAESELDEWLRFFPGQDMTLSHPAVPMVEAFTTFYENENSQYAARDNVLALDWTNLKQNMNEEGVAMLLNDPENAFAAIALAMYRLKVAATCPRSEATYIPRVSGLDVSRFKSIKSHSMGKLVSLRGTVIRASNIKPKITSLTFTCCSCGSKFTQHFVDGKYKVPTSCKTGQCRSKRFDPNFKNAVSVDWQTIRLQENVDGARENGRMPRTIDCELTEDLVDSCVPGDIVTVIGVVKRQLVEGTRGRAKKNKAVYYVYLDANNIINSKKHGKGFQSEDLQREDIMMIRELASKPDVFRWVVNSLCPSIFGHELVKAGLALALFGGSHRAILDESIKVRGDPHVLVVGDPGLGKSQMLRAVSALAPRGVYVCGSYASTSGLTVTLSRDPASGDYALEAGALVLADQGLCCIDEFDKMQQEHAALLEAMEQQTISIAKAGIVCTLMARTSVIAAANPKGGHYDRSKTVAENLKLSPALLSRFDLVFILLDRPDAEMDQRLSEHVMSLHSGSSRNPVHSQPSQRPSGVFSQMMRGGTQQTSSQVGRQLLDYLRAGANDPAPIPVAKLRKYVQYARRTCQPKITPEAADVIQRFYMKLRVDHMSKDAVPVTNRQLEALVRLAEARARLELREFVTLEDAKQVVEIMQESLMETWEDQFGRIDVGRASGMSKNNQKKSFYRALVQRKDRLNNATFTFNDLREVAKTCGVFDLILDFRGFIDELNSNGFLVKRGPRTWELCS